MAPYKEFDKKASVVLKLTDEGKDVLTAGCGLSSELGVVSPIITPRAGTRGLKAVRLQYTDEEGGVVGVTTEEEMRALMTRIAGGGVEDAVLTVKLSGGPLVLAGAQNGVGGKQGETSVDAPAKEPPVCPVKMIIFTVNLIVGLVLSQLAPEYLPPTVFFYYKQIVKLCTMFCLSFIMTHVGYEFDIDKSKKGQYGKDYLIAMTAAAFPWVFVAFWFVYCLGEGQGLPWGQALIAARFASPTSAGILFSMLEASGLKETWLFKKARILAIFDDLDTIILMVPLKVMVVGMQWELSIDLLFVVVLLAVAYIYLHRVKIPSSWSWTMLYAFIVTIVCEFVHFATHSPSFDPMDLVDTVHLEVLLPAFAVGCIAVHQHDHGSSTHGEEEKGGCSSPSTWTDDEVSGVVSAVFMIFVGLSMPPLFSDPAAHAHHRLLGAAPDAHGSSAAAPLDPSMLAAHVACVTVLMILGKMFPTFCYRDEAGVKTRLALSFGMCPRGEVGAGVIVISLGFGISGPAISIAVMALAINLSMSSGFIMLVKTLSKEEALTAGKPKAIADASAPPTPADKNGAAAAMD